MRWQWRRDDTFSRIALQFGRFGWIQCMLGSRTGRERSHSGEIRMMAGVVLLVHLLMDRQYLRRDARYFRLARRVLMGRRRCWHLSQHVGVLLLLLQLLLNLLLLQLALRFLARWSAGLTDRLLPAPRFCYSNIWRVLLLSQMMLISCKVMRRLGWRVDRPVGC